MERPGPVYVPPPIPGHEPETEYKCKCHRPRNAIHDSSTPLRSPPLCRHSTEYRGVDKCLGERRVRRPKFGRRHPVPPRKCVGSVCQCSPPQMARRNTRCHEVDRRVRARSWRRTLPPRPRWRKHDLSATKSRSTVHCRAHEAFEISVNPGERACRLIGFPFGNSSSRLSMKSWANTNIAQPVVMTIPEATRKWMQ